MPVSIAALEAMVATGATAEMLLAVIKADHASKDEGRKKDAARKREARAASKMSSGRARTSADIVAGPRAAEPSPVAATIGGRSDAASTSLRPDTEFAQKERSPTPPKEKLHPKNSEQDLFEGQEGDLGITRARGKRAACRLPDDWQPCELDTAFARTLLPEARIQHEADKFRDHWHAANGPPSIKRNWSAAWRNWCRRAVEISARNGNGQHQQNGNGGSGAGGFGSIARERARAAGLHN